MKLDRYHYLFNAAAYFAAAEKYPENGIVAAIAGQGPESFDALCWALAERANWRAGIWAMTAAKC